MQSSFEADLHCADLTFARLNWARLNEANLTGANLAEANLYEANLFHADLTGADLTGAKSHECCPCWGKARIGKPHGGGFCRSEFVNANLSEAILVDAKS